MSFLQNHLIASHRALFLRKLIHLSIGLVIFILSWVIERDLLIYLIIGGTIFSFVTFRLERFQFIHSTGDASLGTLFYPMGILLSGLILRNLPLYYFQSSLLVLSVSDTLANLSGRIKKGNTWFRMFHDKKSLFGTLAFAVSAYLIFKLLLPPFLNTDFQFLFFCVLLSVILENAAMRGSDNFTIPVGLSLLFYYSYHTEIDYLTLILCLLVLAPGCFLLYRFEILTRKASFIAFLLGFYLAVLPGWSWFLTVLLFFCSSSAFTKLHHSIRSREKKPVSRNSWQVIANILWAVASSALYILSGNEFFILLFILFVSAVTADTWASELGPIFHKRSFSLATRQMEPSGVNGGISFLGSAAALTGSFFISSFSYFLFFHQWDWRVIAIISFSAFLSSFTDSLLGAFVENRLMRMKYFEDKGSNESVSPNDLINSVGSFSAIGFFLILSMIF